CNLNCSCVRDGQVRVAEDFPAYPLGQLPNGDTHDSWAFLVAIADAISLSSSCKCMTRAEHGPAASPRSCINAVVGEASIVDSPSEMSAEFSELFAANNVGTHIVILWRQPRPSGDDAPLRLLD